MEFITGVWEGLVASSWLEILAVIFGLLSVWFARQESILVYPTGIVSVVIYIYICAEYKLYADMGINAYYFIISIYGWYYWSKGGANNKTAPISYLSKKEWVEGVLITLLSLALIYYVLLRFTDSDVPFYDALNTSIFIISMVWMARKKIEHWLGWILGDLLSIPLYLYKGLPFTSFQYFIFTGIAISGYLKWKKIKNS